jgi:hypothetical protein
LFTRKACGAGLDLGQVSRVFAVRYPQFVTQRQSEAADLLLLDTDEFIGLLEKTHGRVLRWKKPGPQKKEGGLN